MSDMKILTLDIETSQIEASVWGIWQQNIPILAIQKPTRMLSWAAKWYGSDEILWAGEKTHGHSDMVHAIYELVDEADVVVGYNSKKFDMKHLNREFILEDLPPPTSYKDIDLLTVVRSNFSFPSNKLDYVAGVLLGRHKMSHAGLQLWIDCELGKKEAWDTMIDYNIEDVDITDELYTKLRGWIKGHPNHGLYVEDQLSPTCRNCGSKHVVTYDSWAPTNVMGYQRYKCKDCGANLRGRKAVIGGKLSPGVLV